jgi:hypothetical protein
MCIYSSAVYDNDYEFLTPDQKLTIFLMYVLSFILGTFIIQYGWNLIAVRQSAKPIDFTTAMVVRLLLLFFVG